MVPVEVAIERLRNPKPGGKIWAAQKYGVDLTQLIQRLQETPDQRVRNLESVMRDVEGWRPLIRRDRRLGRLPRRRTQRRRVLSALTRAALYLQCKCGV
jgi:hypothetical protein